MTRRTLVDNDVLIKGSAYSLWDLLTEETVQSFSVLGAARFVVPDAIGRHSRIENKDRAQASWQAFLVAVEELEPTADELDLATTLEETANQVGIPLDVGESQLCAMAIQRTEAVVLTGDKRAIVAAERLRPLVARLAELDGRVACLEQLLQGLGGALGMAAVRASVCSESAVDRALSACFSCASQHEVADVDDGGLVSYINHLRLAAPHLLASSF